MKFFGMIILLIISCYVIYKLMKKKNEYEDFNDYSAPRLLAIIISWVIVGILVCIVVTDSYNIFTTYTQIDSYVAKNMEIYKSLTYQLETGMYDNDNELGKKELYNQIQDWNHDLAEYQALQKDFWYGIYYPNIFDQFEFIEYPENNKSNVWNFRL